MIYLMLPLVALTFSLTAEAQTRQVSSAARPLNRLEEISDPLLALPGPLRADAGVVKWKPDFTYETLKESRSGLVCYAKPVFSGQAEFAMECTSMGNLPRAAQNLKAEADAQGDRARSEAILNALERNGTRIKPEYGSVWYYFAGADREHARTHMIIAVPGATAESLGIPDRRTNISVSIMNGGTTTAHILLPGQ